MTPELMQAGAEARARAAARSADSGYAGGRTVSYGRRVEPAAMSSESLLSARKPSKLTVMSSR